MAYSTITKPADYFNTVLWTATGSAQTITGVGFNPDLVWNKARNAVGYRGIVDRVRGDGALLFSDATNAEDTSYGSDVLALENDGFSVQASTWSTNNYVTWNWLAGGTASSNTDGSITSSVSANTTSGFSIVSYTGTGANATVGHGLGIAPKCVIIKDRSTTSNWIIGHEGKGWGSVMIFTTSAGDTASSYWQDTAPSSSVVTIGTAGTMNTSGNNYIAYCFAEKKGFSKFGSYTGNGSADGTFVYTGFKPAMIIVKSSSLSGTFWDMYDSTRNTSNPTTLALFPNSSAAEETSYTERFDLLSNGFKVRTTASALNTSGATYIYMAFAENPLVANTGGGIPTTAR